MAFLVILGLLILTTSYTAWYVLLPLSNTYHLAHDVDTTHFLSLSQVQAQRGKQLFLTRWSNLLLHPLISDDLYQLWHGLTDELWPQSVRIFSLYRSIQTQAILKARRQWTQQYRFTASPWASEHHLGTTIDIEFIRNHHAGFQWLKNNAYRYGFIQSFPSHCKPITGIPEEQWHWRWIGKDLAWLFWKISSGNTTLCLQTFLERLHEFDIISSENIWHFDHREARQIGLSEDEIEQLKMIWDCNHQASHLAQRACEKKSWLITLWPLLLPSTTPMILTDTGWHIIENRGRYRVILGRLTPFRRDPSIYHTPSTALLFASTPWSSDRHAPHQAQAPSIRLW